MPHACTGLVEQVAAALHHAMAKLGIAHRQQVRALAIESRVEEADPSEGVAVERHVRADEIGKDIDGAARRAEIELGEQAEIVAMLPARRGRLPDELDRAADPVGTTAREGREQGVEPCRHRAGVVIEEGDDLAARVFDAAVSRVVQAERPFEHAAAVESLALERGLRHLARRIAAPIVDDDDFVALARERLRRQAGERFTEPARPVPGADDDGDFRSVHDRRSLAGRTPLTNACRETGRLTERSASLRWPPGARESASRTSSETARL